LAQGIAAIPGILLDPASVESNIVIFDISGTGRSSAEISKDLKSRGVLMNGINPRQMRAVTHYDVSSDDCAAAAAILSEVAQPALSLT
ncbi:MAG: L-threonine aldolase, partial [Bryobacterales bacterium]|nr:L-threonine aldolase [Bryobacterales bacterium]